MKGNLMNRLQKKREWECPKVFPPLKSISLCFEPYIFIPISFHCVPSTTPAYGNHRDRKSTRLNSSHVSISYAVFCLKKKTNFSRKAPAERYLARFVEPSLDRARSRRTCVRANTPGWGCEARLQSPPVSTRLYTLCID